LTQKTPSRTFKGGTEGTRQEIRTATRITILKEGGHGPLGAASIEHQKGKECRSGKNKKRDTAGTGVRERSAVRKGPAPIKEKNNHSGNRK